MVVFVYKVVLLVAGDEDCVVLGRGWIRSTLGFGLQMAERVP